MEIAEKKKSSSPFQGRSGSGGVSLDRSVPRTSSVRYPGRWRAGFLGGGPTAGGQPSLSESSALFFGLSSPDSGLLIGGQSELEAGIHGFT